MTEATKANDLVLETSLVNLSALLGNFRSLTWAKIPRPVDAMELANWPMIVLSERLWAQESPGEAGNLRTLLGSMLHMCMAFWDAMRGECISNILVPCAYDCDASAFHLMSLI